MNQKIEIQRLVSTNGTNRCVSKFAQAIHIHVYGRSFFDNFVYIVDSWLLACCQPHGLEAVVLWVSHTAILGTVAEWPAGQLDILLCTKMLLRFTVLQHLRVEMLLFAMFSA